MRPLVRFWLIVAALSAVLGPFCVMIISFGVTSLSTRPCSPEKLDIYNHILRQSPFAQSRPFKSPCVFLLQQAKSLLMLNSELLQLSKPVCYKSWNMFKLIKRLN